MLLADIEALDEVRVTLCILCFEIVEQAASASDQHQQAAAGMMILCVCFEVVGQIVDALAQNSNLHFWRTRVGIMRPVTADQLRFCDLCSTSRCPPRTAQKPDGPRPPYAEKLSDEQAQDVRSEQPRDAKNRTVRSVAQSPKAPRADPAGGSSFAGDDRSAT